MVLCSQCLFQCYFHDHLCIHDLNLFRKRDFLWPMESCPAGASKTAHTIQHPVNLALGSTEVGQHATDFVRYIHVLVDTTNRAEENSTSLQSICSIYRINNKISNEKTQKMKLLSAEDNITKITDLHH